MKHIKTIAILLVMFAANSMSAQSTFDKWPTIKAFHEVISATFHASEDGNLEPVKTRSKELSLAAHTVKQSEIPAEYKTTAILAAVDKLDQKALDVHNLVVAQKADAQIKQELKELHDIFHEIVGLCAKKK